MSVPRPRTECRAYMTAGADYSNWARCGVWNSEEGSFRDGLVYFSLVEVTSGKEDFIIRAY